MSKYCFKCRVQVDVNYGFMAFVVSFPFQAFAVHVHGNFSFEFQNISFLQFPFSCL